MPFNLTDYWCSKQTSHLETFKLKIWTFSHREYPHATLCFIKPGCSFIIEPYCYCTPKETLEYEQNARTVFLRPPRLPAAIISALECQTTHYLLLEGHCILMTRSASWTCGGASEGATVWVWRCVCVCVWDWAGVGSECPDPVLRWSDGFRYCLCSKISYIFS